MSSSCSPCPVWVGTSGYCYPGWEEAGFYTKGIGAARMLPEYARHFAATELDHTWYRMPTAEAMERRVQDAPPGFLFTAKLTRTLTHDVGQAWREQAAAFRCGVAPLVKAERLVAVLIQFPHRFRRDAANRAYLAALLDALSELPLAVEFRNASWAQDRVFAELERRKVALVTVDEPRLPGLFPALDLVTDPRVAYARFHGRSPRGWYSGSKDRQFDYDYTRQELEEWVQGTLARLAARARRAVVFFNNHVAARAPRNAAVLRQILQDRGFEVPTAGPA